VNSLPIGDGASTVCGHRAQRLAQSRPQLYPAWQEYFRKHQPPVLIAWGKNDQIFPAAGAEPYKRDLKKLEYHLLDAGHFALETNGDEIAKLMREFLGKHVAKK
jgi:pimeloyl-ACP methyl ester carboxylesterase